MKTASFFSYVGPGRISIARFAPRNTPAGFRVYRPLAPGAWFRSVPEAEYRRLYAIQLSLLDPVMVITDLDALAGAHEPVLLCYERKEDCCAGKTFCHRFMVASWLKSEIGLEVAEFNQAKK